MILSALAFWPGLYLAGAVLFVIYITDAAPIHPFGPALFALMTGVGVYLLDRIKISDRRLDPADRAARPARFAFLTAHTAGVRLLAAASLAASVLIAWRSAPPGRIGWLAAVPLVAAAGVVVYAAGPRRTRPRPKDIIVFKNAYVASGIVGFALLTARLWEPAPLLTSPDHITPWVFTAGVLFARVFADATLCDLDDIEADTRFGTSTIPGSIGVIRTKRAAITARVLLAAFLAIIPIGPTPARLAWAGLTVLSSILLLPLPPRRFRDPVDIALGVEAVCVGLLLAVR